MSSTFWDALDFMRAIPEVRQRYATNSRQKSTVGRSLSVLGKSNFCMLLETTDDSGPTIEHHSRNRVTFFVLVVPKASKYPCRQLEC